MTILVPTQGVDDWKRLLADPQKHWQEGYSAMSTAFSWEAAKGLPREVAALLGPAAKLLLAIPEHKVVLPGGGYPSQCDVFALVDLGAETCALAVEAKVNEPFGPTLAEWQPSLNENRVKRLDGILELLGAKNPPSGLRYQLFHRTAAAILEARRFRTGSAAMIVQSFSPERRWFEDFQAFCRFLDADAEPDRPVQRKLPDGCRLTLGWASAPKTASLQT